MEAEEIKTVRLFNDVIIRRAGEGRPRSGENA